MAVREQLEADIVRAVKSVIFCTGPPARRRIQMFVRWAVL
jgi:hypothetical protein